MVSITIIAILAILFLSATVGVIAYVIMGTWTVFWVFLLCALICVSVCITSAAIIKWIIEKRRNRDNA